MKPVKSILILALPRHNEKYNSTTWQLATVFAKKDVRVFYVDHFFTWTDFVRRCFRKPLINALINTFFPRWITVQGVRVLPPVLFLPVNFLPFGKIYKTINRRNQAFLSGIINDQLKKEKVGPYHLINSFDFYLNEMHHLLKTPVQFIYHCIDPMIKAYTRKHGARQETQIAVEACKVIATSPALARKFRLLGIESYFVPNAANVAHCQKALLSETSEDLVIGKMRKPILGYLGNIERRMDFDLVLGMAQRLTEWNIVLVGPQDDRYIPEVFRNHPRIHLLPAVGAEEIPSVLKSFNVAMVPFKTDEVSNGIFPLKLFEYMAAGLPVVSTSFNPDILKDFEEGIVYLGDTPEEMAEQVKAAFFLNHPSLIRWRVGVANLNSWERRADDFLGILDNSKACLVN